MENLPFNSEFSKSIQAHVRNNLKTRKIIPEPDDEFYNGQRFCGYPFQIHETVHSLSLCTL